MQIYIKELNHIIMAQRGYVLLKISHLSPIMHAKGIKKKIVKWHYTRMLNKSRGTLFFLNVRKTISIFQYIWFCISKTFNEPFSKKEIYCFTTQIKSSIFLIGRPVFKKLLVLKINCLSDLEQHKKSTVIKFETKIIFRINVYILDFKQIFETCFYYIK